MARISVVLTLCGLGCSGTSSEPSRVPRELAFETLAKTATAAVQTRDHRLVTDEARWATAWADLRTGQPRPAVDFRREMVVAAFMGAQANGCFDLRVASIREEAGTLSVSLVRTEPGPACVCAALIATPAHAVRVERVDKPPTFSETVERRSCP